MFEVPEQIRQGSVVNSNRFVAKETKVNCNPTTKLGGNEKMEAVIHENHLL